MLKKLSDFSVVMNKGDSPMPTTAIGSGTLIVTIFSLKWSRHQSIVLIAGMVPQEHP